MKYLAVLFLAMGAVGCKTMQDNQQHQYILKLAEVCETISISPRGTDLICTNHREQGNARSKVITATQD